MLKIRRPLGRLIFNMGIAIPGKTIFLIETAPSFLLSHCLKWKLPRHLQTFCIPMEPFFTDALFHLGFISLKAVRINFFGWWLHQFSVSMDSVYSCKSKLIYSTILAKDTPQLTCESEVWDVFCGREVLYMFHILMVALWCAIFGPCYNRTWLYKEMANIDKNICGSVPCWAGMHGKWTHWYLPRGFIFSHY